MVKREVTIAGCYSCLFVYGTESCRNPYTREKERGEYPAILIYNEFIKWHKEKQFLAGHIKSSRADKMAR